MSNYKVHTGVAIPPKARAGRPASKYAYGDMAVGNSFFVTLDKDEVKTVLERLRTAAARWKTVSDQPTHKFRVSACEDPETKQPAVGTWRIA
jgi:hypothetical protein